MTDKKSFGSFTKTKRTEKNYSQKDLTQMLLVTEGAEKEKKETPWRFLFSFFSITAVAFRRSLHAQQRQRSAQRRQTPSAQAGPYHKAQKAQDRSAA